MMVYSDSMLPSSLLTFEHSQDVLRQLLDWHEMGQTTALVIVTDTIGGAVRAPGAMMAVSKQGDSAGYISGGCIDADVRHQALSVIETQTPAEFIYGKGSPFIDLPLPCGGAIHLFIIPIADVTSLLAALRALDARKASSLIFLDDGSIDHTFRSIPTGYSDTDFIVRLLPKLRLRIAGRGADCLALANLAQLSGIEVTLQLTDDTDKALAYQAGIQSIEMLKTTKTLSNSADDRWTAFTLMFHDGNWETELLAQAISGPAFYIGAVGSRKTHARRMDELWKSGIPEVLTEKINGPIGLVPSLRDASLLAVSTLAEIIQKYQERPEQKILSSGVILLAAGASSRFKDGDKLTAELGGRPTLEHVISCLDALPFKRRIAVTGTDHESREQILLRSNWPIARNLLTESGQASSIKCGLSQIVQTGTLDSVLIMLGDMPCIPSKHIEDLYDAFETGVDAVMTSSEGVLCPPALFNLAHYEKLNAIDGDKGAKSIFRTLKNTRTIELAPDLTLDIDTIRDLKLAEDKINA